MHANRISLAGRETKQRMAKRPPQNEHKHLKTVDHLMTLMLLGLGNGVVELTTAGDFSPDTFQEALLTSF